jgi:hypothetical protein
VSRLGFLKSLAVPASATIHDGCALRAPSLIAAIKKPIARVPHAHETPLVSRSILSLTVPVAITALVLLSWTAVSLLRTVRGSVVTSVPIRAEQQVHLNATGNLALNLEGPLGALLPTKLHYALSSADGAMRIPLASIAFRTEVTSMSRSRIDLYGLTIPAPGDYVLRIDGLDPSVDYSACAIIIARQYGASLVLHVLALVALGVALIGSIVVSGLVLSGKI